MPWEHLPWFELYRLALLEMDLCKLLERINTAEAAIKARIVELTDSPETLELSALRNALEILQIVREEERRKRAS